jgi:hypothetical protein
MMKAIATLKLTIDIDQAQEMGYEIEDPKEYAVDEFIEWVYEMVRYNDLNECVHVEIEGESNG